MTETEPVPNAKEEISDLEQKIIRQIEYYFGDYNLSKDKFLQETISKDDGWLSLEILIKFNRLKQLSEDFNVITTALKKSPNQLLEINEENTKIRRRLDKPIPEDLKKMKDELTERSVYVKGFKVDTTLDELLEFFKDYKAEHITMRRRYKLPSKPFKGSVFVTFATNDDAKNFLERNDLKYNGKELLKETKKAYIKRKDEFFQQLREEKEKKKQKQAMAIEEATKSAGEEMKINMTEGSLIKIEGLGECTRDDIKQAFSSYGSIAYVDHGTGKSTAVVRFETGIAQSVFDQVVEDGTNTMEICSDQVTLTVLKGEEEVDYWKSIAKSRALTNMKRKQNKFPDRYSKKKRGRRGFSGKDKTDKKNGNEVKNESNDNENDNEDEVDNAEEPPQKKFKSEQDKNEEIVSNTNENESVTT